MFQTICSQKSCQNCFNRSKLANKRPKWSNSEKNETHEKREKMQQIAESRLVVIFVTKYQYKIFFCKKLILDQSRAKTALNHMKLAQKQQTGPNSAKLKNSQKQPKLQKVSITRLKKSQHCDES